MPSRRHFCTAVGAFSALGVTAGCLSTSSTELGSLTVTTTDAAAHSGHLWLFPPNDGTTWDARFSLDAYDGGSTIPGVRFVDGLPDDAEPYRLHLSVADGDNWEWRLSELLDDSPDCVKLDLRLRDSDDVDVLYGADCDTVPETTQ